MKFVALHLVAISFLLLNSCAKICKTRPISVQVSATKTATIKESQVPCKEKEKFESAALLTLEAIHSSEFETRLEKFHRTELRDGEHVAAWKNVTVQNVVSGVRNKVDGTYANSYGGVTGLFKFLIVGNVAYDGGIEGPIRFNRWALSKRSIPQVSNTIAHEVAHRAGLKHPTSGSSLEVANKEPAYVVGNIIQEIVTDLRNKAEAGER